ncbi:DNA-binding transcriptional LysR family regulator [Lederbergia galactosidilyticus]|uniref:LysR family transcriptional regulator n=1 Tax=Lederbergia galactosidilytica TaxID=217031 RepID=UPI000716FC9D|nr:LysR family transcriptional regulator [Lederbergia galactosidilytica]MBP1914183.1 DNA-binding transcriptional LysR family regulator [Lederbergia galactosidilytica]
MSIDLLQLKYFQVVAKHQHLTRAATELNITQPALSKMIAKLEKVLGYQLFDRRGRQIQLNSLGEAYLRTVENVFLELKMGEAELAYLADHQNKVLSISVTIPSLLPDLLGDFLVRYPGTRFRQHQASFEKMVQQLEAGEIDLGISTKPVAKENIEWIPILEEEILLTVPLSHPLANRKAVYLKEVEKDPFVVMPTGYDFRTMTEHFCHLAGFSPDFAFEGDETGITQELVERGLGVAFYPTVLINDRVRKMKTAKLKIIEPRCTRTVGLIRAKNRKQTNITMKFSQFVIEYLKNRQKDQDE